VVEIPATWRIQVLPEMYALAFRPVALWLLDIHFRPSPHAYNLIYADSLRHENILLMNFPVQIIVMCS